MIHDRANTVKGGTKPLRKGNIVLIDRYNKYYVSEVDGTKGICIRRETEGVFRDRWEVYSFLYKCNIFLRRREMTKLG